jgi:hypothetical protein
MRSKKAFYKSKGLWGPVIALVALMFDMREWGPVDQAAVWGAVDQIATWGGVLVGAWGRVAAKEGLAVKDEVAPPDAPETGVASDWRRGTGWRRDP